jgi:hypothetical protein
MKELNEMKRPVKFREEPIAHLAGEDARRLKIVNFLPRIT